MELKYQNPDLPSCDVGKAVIPSYTGNITQWNWRHLDPDNAGLPHNSYGFSYDVLSRLTDNPHFVRADSSSAGVVPAAPMTERDLQYDLNGNVRSLRHQAKNPASTSVGVEDRLAFEYDGNKLLALDHNNLSGSVEAAGRYRYSYDPNGNMVTDERKSLDFQYNFLNLVEKVSDSVKRADYVWLSDGRKQAVSDNDGNGYLYAGSLVYTKQSGGAWALESTGFDSGRILATTGVTADVSGMNYRPYYQLAVP